MASDRFVELAPFSRGAGAPLSGFVMSGRWPDNTLEWAKLLTLAVRFAAVPGMVRHTSVFRASDDRPEASAMVAPIGLILCMGPVVGADAPAPGALSVPVPTAVLLLHPPEETSPSLPEAGGAASGCVLLPGVPEIGLDHRAVWVEASADGSVSRLVSSTHVNPLADADTAVLALLCAA